MVVCVGVVVDGIGPFCFFFVYGALHVVVVAHFVCVLYCVFLYACNFCVVCVSVVCLCVDCVLFVYYVGSLFCLYVFCVSVGVCVLSLFFFECVSQFIVMYGALLHG